MRLATAAAVALQCMAVADHTMADVPRSAFGTGRSSLSATGWAGQVDRDASVAERGLAAPADARDREGFSRVECEYGRERDARWWNDLRGKVTAGTGLVCLVGFGLGSERRFMGPIGGAAGAATAYAVLTAFKRGMLRDCAGIEWTPQGRVRWEEYLEGGHEWESCIKKGARRRNWTIGGWALGMMAAGAGVGAAANSDRTGVAVSLGAAGGYPTGVLIGGLIADKYPFSCGPRPELKG